MICVALSQPHVLTLPGPALHPGPSFMAPLHPLTHSLAHTMPPHAAQNQAAGTARHVSQCTLEGVYEPLLTSMYPTDRDKEFCTLGQRQKPPMRSCTHAGDRDSIPTLNASSLMLARTLNVLTLSFRICRAGWVKITQLQSQRLPNKVLKAGLLPQHKSHSHVKS